MPQSQILGEILNSAIDPKLQFIPFDSVKFLGELFFRSLSGEKTICMVMKDKLLICQSVELVPGNYKIKGSIMIAHFSFDLQFEILNGPKNSKISNIGIKFLKNACNDFALYFTENQQEKQKFISSLKKYLIEREFHEFFKPIKKLGQGNYATVFQVKRYKDNKLFVVKAFSKNHLSSSPKEKQSLINELGILRELNHINILKLQGVYQSDNSIYVLLELISGESLSSFLHKTQNLHLKAREIFIFMKRLLQGLLHMHGKRIMHRDLKPENIMLRERNIDQPVIVDFGLSSFCDIEEYLFFRCGTPGYVAPQIIMLRDNETHIQPICDVFSAGAIFHLLITGRALFQGTDFEQIYMGNKTIDFQLDEEEINSKTDSVEAYDLLVKMLDKDPSNRITVSEALDHPFFTHL